VLQFGGIKARIRVLLVRPELHHTSLEYMHHVLKAVKQSCSRVLGHVPPLHFHVSEIIGGKFGGPYPVGWLASFARRAQMRQCYE